MHCPRRAPSLGALLIGCVVCVPKVSKSGKNMYELRGVSTITPTNPLSDCGGSWLAGGAADDFTKMATAWPVEIGALGITKSELVAEFGWDQTAYEAGPHTVHSHTVHLPSARW